MAGQEVSPLAFRSFQSDRVRFRTRAEGSIRPKLAAVALWAAAAALFALFALGWMLIDGFIGLDDLDWFLGVAAIVAVAGASCYWLYAPARATLELRGKELTLRRRFTAERFHAGDVLDAWSAPADDGYRAHLELADGRILSLVLNPEAARSLVEAVQPTRVTEESVFALTRIPRGLSVLGTLSALSRCFGPKLALHDEDFTVSWLSGRVHVPYLKVLSADYGPRGVLIELVEGGRLLLEPSAVFDPGFEPGLFDANSARAGMQLAAQYESLARCIAARAAAVRCNSTHAYRLATVCA
jgi:hypothetical protein